MAWKVWGLAISLSLFFAGSASAQTDPFAAIGTYDRADYDRAMTECDEIGAHPSDPERVGEGREREAMDLPSVISACLVAVEADPANPRLNYQLARAYGYSGLHEEGQPYRDTALNTGYPQSLFVIGYIRLTGWDGAEADPCYGGELIRRSAEVGRFAGLVGFPHYALSGAFDECESYPVRNASQMQAFLDAAQMRAGDYYQRLLVANLEARLADQ